MTQVLDKPVDMWSHHAKQRVLWLCKLRAYLSLAGTRDRLMLFHIKRGSKILDVGCGGGRPVLAELGDVVGLEPIDRLASQARGLYREVVGATAEKMPFEDESFDAVVSTDILGHIPVALKDAVMSEMFRVLRPGGITLHVAEADSDGWLARIAKREPEPYRQNWVEAPDHRAMEPASIQMERFRRAGFVLDKVLPYQPIIPECGLIGGAMKDHKHLPLWLSSITRIDVLLSRNNLVRELVSLALTPLAFLNLWSAPERGLGLIIMAHKPTAAEKRTSQSGAEIK